MEISNNDDDDDVQPPKKRNRTTIRKRSQMNELSEKGNQNYTRKKNINKLVSVEEAVIQLQDDFETIIGFTPSEIKTISNKLYYNDGESDFQITNNKNQNIAVILFEELIMTLSMRFRYALRSLSAISLVTGRDPSLTSKIIRQGMIYLLNRFEWTIEFAYLHRYGLCVEQWNQHIAARYESKYGESWTDLPLNFQSISTILDGTRVNIRRPKNKIHQKLLYSEYTKSHNFIVLGLMAPNGFCVAASDPIIGSTNDADASKEVNLVHYLKDILNSTCLCDGRFKYESSMISLRNTLCEAQIITEAQLKALRGIRVSVENGFANLKNGFPYFTEGNLKLAENAPTLVIKATILLSNIKTCLRGNNVSKQFGLTPPSLDEYLGL